MAIKTISLELDAYEKLRRAKRGRESFSEVVRRARFDEVSNSGEAILRELETLHAGRSALTQAVVEYWDRVGEEERVVPRVSASHWGK